MRFPNIGSFAPQDCWDFAIYREGDQVPAPWPRLVPLRSPSIPAVADRRSMLTAGRNSRRCCTTCPTRGRIARTPCGRCPYSS
jgi:hypothetical protein